MWDVSNEEAGALLSFSSEFSEVQTHARDIIPTYSERIFDDRWKTKYQQ